MLRKTVMAVVAVALAATLVCAGLAAAGIVSASAGFALWVALQLAIVLAGLVFERVHYKPLETVTPAGFVPTPERFVDPATGQPVQVWFDAGTGERRYVATPKA